MRIHPRPARFMWRVRARRAASICRAVTRSGSSALRPYCPKLSSVPAFEVPWIRPLCALRNLVRIGCSMAYVSLPSIRSLGGVGAQGGQRPAALAVPFHARDLGAAEPTGAVDADAFRAKPHGRLHRALHGAAESDAALEPLGDPFPRPVSVKA